MTELKRVAPETFLSELYATDCPDAVLLTEYPSSNSDQTRFQNFSKFTIHDPATPPKRELLKILGPHHLMLGWGQAIDVCSDVRPPQELFDHWERTFGARGVPHWRLPDENSSYITLFPHQSLSGEQQIIDPELNYRLHSKEVIEKIDCNQAAVLDRIEPPCIVKLTHGYAGLSNFFVRNHQEAKAVRQKMDQAVARRTVCRQRHHRRHSVGRRRTVLSSQRRDGSLAWFY